MNVFELFAKISLDTSGYEKGLKDSESKMKSVGSAIGGGLKTAAKVGAAAIGVASTAIGALAKKSIDNYAEYEQLVGGVDTLFKKSSDRVQKYAENAYKTAGMSANDYMETVTSFSASLLQSLGGDTKKSADYAHMAIVDMSDNANKMGTSMESIQNAYQGFAKQNYSMLDNLKLGYGGTSKEMFRLLGDAAMLNKEFAKTADFSIDEKGHLEAGYADIVQAIHIVQDEMGIMNTTKEEAATTIEGSVNSMKAAWQNLVTGLANGNADVGELTKNLLESAKTVFDNIVPVLKQALSGISEFMGEVAPAIGEELPKIVSDLLPVIMNGAMELVTGLTTGLLNGLPQLATVAIQVVQSLVSGIMEKMPELLDTAIKILDTIVNGITSNVESLATSAILIVSQLAQMLIARIPDLVKVALELIKGLASGLLKALPELVKQIPAIVNGLVNALLESIPMIIDAGVELLTSLVEDLPEIIDSLIEAIPLIITNLIDALVKNAPKIAEAGFKLLVSLVTSLPQIIVTILKAIPKLLVSIINALLNGIPKLISTGKELLGSMFKKLPEILGMAKDGIKNIMDTIIDVITDNNLIEAGKNLIKGLWDGITSVKDWLFDKIGDFGDGLVKKVKGVFKIKSPSRVFAEIGKFLALGLGEGWEDTFPDVQNGIEDDLAFDVGQAVSDIEASVRTTGTDGELYTLSDVYSMMRRILESIETSGINTVSAIENTDTSIVLNDREFGRAVRKVYA